VATGTGTVYCTYCNLLYFNHNLQQ